MITVSAVSSTALAWLRPFVICALLAACTGLPRYGVALPALAPPLFQADDVFTMPDGVRLPVRVWMPSGQPKAVVLALHGFNDSRDAWEIPAPAFNAAGIAVYAPDQRGFGAAPGRGFWPGSAQLTDDAAAMLRLLRQRFPGVPLYAMGESMGGAVLMTLAARDDAPPVAGWILLSPAVWGRQQMGIALSSGLWLVSSVAPALSVTGAEVPLKVMASDNREALIRLSTDPLTIRRTRFDALRGLTDLMDLAQAAAPHLRGRVLALYGGHDMLVPGQAMARAWSGMPGTARRAFYPAGYHLLLRDKGRRAPTGDVIGWMERPGVWLPSGADLAASAWVAERR
jgi:alpha-beta hydrolase superfamily lysophospholipase